jgi:hypothetical protein
MYNFTLLSHADTAPEPTLQNGWFALFNPLTQAAFESLNTHLDQQGGWYTVCNAPDGGTGAFYDLKGSFNNFGGWPMSYQLDLDCLPGPGVDQIQGYIFNGPSRGSSLVFGNNAGFITGSYPATFSMSGNGTAPYSLSLHPGTQTYSKSDPHFSVAYGVFNCPGTWNTEGYRSVCSVDASFSYSYNNTGTLALAGTQSQTLQPYTASGMCALKDGKGTLATFSDTNGAIVITTTTVANDAAAVAAVQAACPAIGSGSGFMQIEVTQNYTDVLKVTAANDGVFDWSTLPQEPMERVTWAGLNVLAPMTTQALYSVTYTP